jgi:uncharacterized low-complexity protein
MNVKAFAAIVGTLSLGALATGCASNKAATTETQGAQASCGAKEATGEKAGDVQCSTKASTTETKGDAASCGTGSCKSEKK